MEWKKYPTGTPSTTPGWTNPDCFPFSTISHVTHINNALNILSDGLMRPQLVFDESKLQARRILVNWFSPNFWTTGFRYGNVAFQFEWKKLIAGMNIYWVESIDYRIPACRFLITDKDYTGDTDFIAYDPRSHEGPWWYDEATDTHYRNPNVCLEFMVEAEVNICDCLATQFVQHHSDYCCIAPYHCPDRDLYKMDAGALFVAGIVSRNLPTECLHMVREENGILQPTDDLRGAITHLLLGIDTPEPNGTITVEAPAATALARAVLAAFNRRDPVEETQLTALFVSNGDLKAVIKAVVCNAFGFPGI